MKRIIILVAIALVSAGMLFADEAILIDFTNLVKDIHARVSADDQGTDLNQNRRTVMDYGQVAGGSFTADQKSVMKTSLAIENWDVKFTSSSQTIENVANTYTRESISKRFFGGGGDNETGTKVMGVRIHYPLDLRYSKATITPPFEIPAFEPMAEVGDDGTIGEATSDGITAPSRFEADEPTSPTSPAYGVVKNVGSIRSVSIHAYGLNFPHGLNVILIDDAGNEKVCFMGYLNYDGWAELTWTNPQYQMEVRNRELRLYPLYPFNTPFVKFGGIRIDRDADRVGGDFVSYFKDVKIIYDKAQLPEGQDVDNELMWNIIKDRETAKKVFEMERFGQNQVLRFLEEQKRAKENWDPLYGENVRDRYGFTPTPGTEAANEAANE